MCKCQELTQVLELLLHSYHKNTQKIKCPRISTGGKKHTTITSPSLHWPVCISSWRRKWWLLRKLSWQTTHLYGRSPVWILTWRRRYCKVKYPNSCKNFHDQRKVFIREENKTYFPKKLEGKKLTWADVTSFLAKTRPQYSQELKVIEEVDANSLFAAAIWALAISCEHHIFTYLKEELANNTPVWCIYSIQSWHKYQPSMKP